MDESVYYINKFSPTIFLEMNTLEASLGILEWTRQRDYLAYGLIGVAFNHLNFNRTEKNIFGQAKECGLLLIAGHCIGKFSARIELLGFPEIKTIDDLTLLLLHKSQYANEVLAQSAAASKLGIGYSSPEQSRTWCFKLHRRLGKHITFLKKMFSRGRIERPELL